jgi:hypothetical protein
MRLLAASRYKWRPGGRFSNLNPRIVQLANADNGIDTPQQLADALGIPLDGPFKRRLYCLATGKNAPHIPLIPEHFLNY